MSEDKTRIMTNQHSVGEETHPDNAATTLPSTPQEYKHESSISSIFLKRMKINSFGNISNKTIGPFSSGLNVVFGKNESGKTTLNAFFGGVLFGWEEARGMRNTYKPKNSERSGALFFRDELSDKEFEYVRTRNADGLQGPLKYIDDIDKDTYSTMFALTSDELRSLKNTTDVTAKLLTAGSGTNASPAHALVELQDRMAEYTSKAAGLDHSLVQLKQKRELLREAISEAGAEAERFKQEDREFHELAPQRDALLKKIDTLNTEIETLTGHRASLEKLEAQREKSLIKQENLREEERSLLLEYRLHEQQQTSILSQLSSAEELAIRDRLDILLEEHTRLDHRLSLAKDTYTESKASYEAFLEADDVQELERKSRDQRRTQIILSVVLPLVFVCSGVPVFIHGREINSLSFTALGIGLVVCALVLASAALVMLFRPNKTDEAQTQKKKDAQWVMLQDKKKLESCEADLHEHETKVQEYLDKVGLQESQGSLRRARMMLDVAKNDRAQESLYVQKQRALVSQLSSVEESLSDTQEQKEKLRSQLAFLTEPSLNAIDAIIAQKMQQRVALTETSGSINRRYGELKQELSQAKSMTRFDELKLSYQQIRTREEESSKEYARLLIAKRMLDSAIAAWESKSQPEVYKQASRLLSLMTAGKWEQVRMTPEGRLQVIDDVKNVREPLYLSLGTCQQLYLSLRIALLMTAENVGRIIPIMADDILVNFDAERREGAVRALVELAAKRQVIIFTCHRGIVRLVQSIDSQTNVLEL